MNNSKKIDCIKQLLWKNYCFNDIMVFLEDEHILTKAESLNHSKATDKPKELVLILERVAQHPSVQLVDYEWQILPVERIVITILTDKVIKKFEYHEC